jgi:hypothetical protein
MNDELVSRYYRLREALSAEQARAEPDMPRIDALIRELDDLQLAIKQATERHPDSNPLG